MLQTVLQHLHSEKGYKLIETQNANHLPPAANLEQRLAVEMKGRASSRTAKALTARSLSVMYPQSPYLT